MGLQAIGFEGISYVQTQEDDLRLRSEKLEARARIDNYSQEACGSI